MITFCSDDFPICQLAWILCFFHVCLLWAHLQELLSSSPFLSPLFPSAPCLFPEHACASLGEGDVYSGSSFQFFPLTSPSVPFHLPPTLFFYGASYFLFHRKLSIPLKKELFFSRKRTTPLSLASKACLLPQRTSTCKWQVLLRVALFISSLSCLHYVCFIVMRGGW